MVKKSSRPFGFEATFFASLCSESLLFGWPGFDPRRLQTLRAHNFVALGPTGSKTTFFERSDLCLLGNRKKIGFAGLLRVLLIGQSTIKLYHKIKSIQNAWRRLYVHMKLLLGLFMKGNGYFSKFCDAV